MEAEGWFCVDCQEWFEVTYNNIPGLEINYCPFCGYEYDAEDRENMEKERQIRSDHENGKAD